MKKTLLTKITAWLLLITTFLYLLTGFGITRARVVTPWTFGILNKVTSFKIHDWLWLPFGIILFLHIILTIIAKRNFKASRKRGI